MIDGKTKILGIFANPVEHTKSPAMHNALAKSLGINAVYVPFFATDNLKEAVAGFRAMGFTGANVSIPFKEKIIPFLDEISPVSKATGSVNTIYWRDGKLCGTSTDGLGALRNLEDAGVEVKGKNVALLGGGGAAKALAYAFSEVGGAASLKSFSIENGNFDDFKNHKDSFDLLCNATPLGMHPKEEQTPVEKSLLNPDMAVFDIVYNPLKTRLLREAEEVGCKTVSGIGMLVHQGLESFKLWFPDAVPSFEVAFEGFALKE